jgi:hypothetical protein
VNKIVRFCAESRNYQEKDSMVRKSDDIVAFASWFPARERAAVGLVIPTNNRGKSAVVVN